MESLLRPKIAKLTSHLLYPLVNEGIVSNAEYALINQNLRNLAKGGTLVASGPSRLLNQSQVAEALGIGLSNFKRLEADKEIRIPRRMVGRSVRYRSNDVQAFIDGCDFNGNNEN